jgi:hypothetical protein
MFCHGVMLKLRTFFVLFAVIAEAGALAPVAAQKDLPVPKSPATEYPVTITGCIRGTRLIPQSAASDTASDALASSEYLLDGSKELLQVIRKDHNGHLDEITGVAQVPATAAAHRAGVGSAPVGKKGRITVGTREESGGVQPAPHPVRLKVTSIRHISNGCSTNRS